MTLALCGRQPCSTELELHVLHGSNACPYTGHVDSRTQSHTSRVSKDARKVDMNTGAHSSWSKARRITAPAEGKS